jgi:uncharacterized protein YndB with AHSA1/START domain
MAEPADDRDADVVEERIFIEAPPERVFRALTTPEELIAWWGDPREYRCTSWTLDLRVGGRWRSEGDGAAGGRFTVEGEFLEIEPPRVLAFTWSPSWVEVPPTRVRIVLEARPGGTHLTWTHSGFAGYPRALAAHRGGLPSVVGWLRAFVEEGRTVSDGGRTTS